MTTLVGIQGKGWAVLGADRRSTDEAGKPLIMETSKIIDNNNVLIAGSGAGRGSNLLQFGWKAPRPTAAQDLDTFITQKFIPEMRKLFVDAGYDMKEDGDAAAHDSEFLVAVRGVIYPIFQDYSWDRDRRGIYYSGSGGHVALGALEALGVDEVKTPEEAAKIIETAIKVAIKWDVYTNGPIDIKIQKSK